MTMCNPQAHEIEKASARFMSVTKYRSAPDRSGRGGMVTHVFESQAPPGVLVKETEDGYRGLFAARDFRHGEVIYAAEQWFLRAEKGEALAFAVVATTPGQPPQTYHFDTRVHCAHDPILGDYFIYPDVGSFVNHSCEQNSESHFGAVVDKVFKNSGISVEESAADFQDGPGMAQFDTWYLHVATRNIKQGDQITCDYEAYEWDMTGNGEIPHCRCGAGSCRGAVLGLRHRQPGGNFPGVEQRHQIAIAEPSLREPWLELNPSVVLLSFDSGEASHHQRLQRQQFLDLFGVSIRQRLQQHHLSETATSCAGLDLEALSWAFVEHLFKEREISLQTFSPADGLLEKKLLWAILPNPKTLVSESISKTRIFEDLTVDLGSWHYATEAYPYEIHPALCSGTSGVRCIPTWKVKDLPRSTLDMVREMCSSSVPDDGGGQLQWDENPTAGFKIPYKVAPVEGMGMGLIATAPIKKGTLLCDFSVYGCVQAFGEASFKKKWLQVAAAQGTQGLLKYFGRFYVLCEFPDTVFHHPGDAQYWNHSEHPNTQVTINSKGLHEAIALRSIDEGEVLTEHYSTYSFIGSSLYLWMCHTPGIGLAWEIERNPDEQWGDPSLHYKSTTAPTNEKLPDALFRGHHLSSEATSNIVIPGEDVQASNAASSLAMPKEELFLRRGYLSDKEDHVFLDAVRDKVLQVAKNKSKSGPFHIMVYGHGASMVNSILGPDMTRNIIGLGKKSIDSFESRPVVVLSVRLLVSFPGSDTPSNQPWHLDYYIPDNCEDCKAISSLNSQSIFIALTPSTEANCTEVLLPKTGEAWEQMMGQFAMLVDSKGRKKTQEDSTSDGAQNLDSGWVIGLKSGDFEAAPVLMESYDVVAVATSMVPHRRGPVAPGSNIRVTLAFDYTASSLDEVAASGFVETDQILACSDCQGVLGSSDIDDPAQILTIELEEEC